MENTAAVPSETITIVEGRTQELEEDTRNQNGRAENGDGTSDNEHMFHSFTPLSFDALAPRVNLSIHHVHLQFNNLPDALLQSLTPWSGSVCHRLLLTERQFNFYSTEYEKTLLIPHKLISLHGITTSTTTNSQVEGTISAAKTAIYCQLDLNLAEICHSHNDVDESLEDPIAPISSPDPIELIITPTDLSIDGSNVEEKNENLKKIVQNLYDSISTCILLNPLPVIINGSEEGGIKDGSFEIDDSLISAFLDNSTDDVILDQNAQQPGNQIDPSNRFHPY